MKNNMQDKKFWSVKLEQLTIDNLGLPFLPSKSLNNKKVESLAKKYHSILDKD